MKNKKLLIIGCIILIVTIMKFPIMGLDPSVKMSISSLLGPLLLASIIYLVPLYFVAKGKGWAKVAFAVILLLTLFMGGSSGIGFANTTHSMVLKTSMFALLIAQVLATIIWFITAFIMKKK
ncbi:hypothetical protein [Sporolactobacillus laevolacticus]|uniref:hypothetical protein n=1 Tax=Sporolactobacillus laevolacticus TaxID=33018 RepID=UPI0025B55E62|nr:hypothetical protein [Sporolactobacillus laevolacticus]MDN3954401.1 hypothetical protein [Sporolactobacillus laevolacticus]